METVFLEVLFRCCDYCNYSAFCEYFDNFNKMETWPIFLFFILSGNMTYYFDYFDYVEIAFYQLLLSGNGSIKCY